MLEMFCCLRLKIWFLRRSGLFHSGVGFVEIIGKGFGGEVSLFFDALRFTLPNSCGGRGF